MSVASLNPSLWRAWSTKRASVELPFLKVIVLPTTTSRWRALVIATFRRLHDTKNSQFVTYMCIHFDGCLANKNTTTCEGES